MYRLTVKYNWGYYQNIDVNTNSEENAMKKVNEILFLKDDKQYLMGRDYSIIKIIMI